MKKKILLYLLAAIILSSQLTLTNSVNAQTKVKLIKLDTQTVWDVRPSFILDTLCFIGVLTGDPFYVRFYKDEYAEFEPRLTPAARQALANLKRKIKDEKKSIISATLTLQFSVTNDQNLNNLLKSVRDSRRMKRDFQKNRLL